jgi:hypothetical protein
LVSAEESLIPKEQNMTVKDLVSDPNASAFTDRYGMIAAGTHPLNYYAILLYVSEDILLLSCDASALVLIPSPISFLIR